MTRVDACSEPTPSAGREPVASGSQAAPHHDEDAVVSAADDTIHGGRSVLIRSDVVKLFDGLRVSDVRDGLD